MKDAVTNIATASREETDTKRPRAETSSSATGEVWVAALEQAPARSPLTYY
jgi:hypothetical protein